MPNLITASAMACLILLVACEASVVDVDRAHNPANTISTEMGHPDSFRHFAPELASARERAAQINTSFGLHVSEIEPGLFFVTDQIYQSAFLVTDAGVVVFDAPSSFGERLLAAIRISAPGVPITHFVMSHAHADHNGGGSLFAEIEGLAVIGAKANADSLAANPLPGILMPTDTFEEALSFEVGGVPIDLRTANFHSSDTDVIIHLPDQRFLMAVDTIAPGEAPFMNFGATSNLQGYLQNFETLLAYDFEHFLSGHVSILGNRSDVETARAYAHDVRDTVGTLWPGFAGRFETNLKATEYQNGNLAYRMTMEQVRDDCTRQIIERWADKLSVVDLWAASHCETAVIHSIMH